MQTLKTTYFAGEWCRGHAVQTTYLLDNKRDGLKVSLMEWADGRSEVQLMTGNFLKGTYKQFAFGEFETVAGTETVIPAKPKRKPAVKKPFEQRVAEVTPAIIDGMISNALNNYHAKSGRIYCKAEIAKMYAGTNGVYANAISIETVSTKEKIEALEWYALNTDWSAFKKWDHAAAMKTLVGKVA